MEVQITLNQNQFNTKGDDVTFDGLQPLFRTWINAQVAGPSDAVKLEELTARLKANNDALASAVATHTKGEET